jgi:hypothetical protein
MHKGITVNSLTTHIFTVGDIVTVSINTRDGTIGYKLNETDLGIAFKDHVLATKKVFACISLSVKSDEVSLVN